MRIIKFLTNMFIILSVLGCVQKSLIISPSEIINNINKDNTDNTIQSTWRKLGIKSEEFENGAPYQVTCSNVELNSEIKSVAVLKISDRFQWNWQYLIFAKESDHWKFFGNIDIPMQKYAPPQHRILKVGKGAIWLVVRSLECSGTGVLLYENTCYELTEKKPRVILNYPVKGHVMGWGVPFNREFTSEVIREGKFNGVYTIKVQFTISYTNALSDEIKELEDIFSTKPKVCYIWDSSKNRFVLDSSNSDLSYKTVNGIFYDGPDGFLKHNFEELMKFATNGNIKEKKWLKKFLKVCKNCPLKMAILAKIQ